VHGTKKSLQIIAALVRKDILENMNGIDGGTAKCHKMHLYNINCFKFIFIYNTGFIF